jgi:glutamyl-Q tRNA(Asp) synthetase
MEDLDASRVVPGAADEILRALQRYGLAWDGEVAVQSRRTALYEDALARLRVAGLVYDCGCTRAEVARAAGAPDASDPVDDAGAVYAGTCRVGLAPGRAARAVRFRVSDGTISFEDRVRGRIEEDVARAVGDFVVRRADGPFAYQLAVVVDDAEQGITEVVRGGDLLSSTGRQIAVQTALGLPTPAYAHLPLVLGPDGKKLGKRNGALPLETLDERRVRETLALALRLLGQEARGVAPGEMLGEAARTFDPTRVPTGPLRVDEGGRIVAAGAAGTRGFSGAGGAGGAEPVEPSAR